MLCVGVGTVYRNEEWSMVSVCLCIHPCARCAFMHAVVSVRCVCMCLNSIYGYKKGGGEALRPAVSWSNWHVNHVSVGGRSVCMCVCERSMTYLQRQHATAGVLSSSPSYFDTPMARVCLGWRERIWASAYHMGLSPNKTLQHVCGNEELCICVRVICQWPPPISLLTWLSLSPLLMFGCFLLFPPPPPPPPLPPPRCTLEGNKEERNPTPSLP